MTPWQWIAFAGMFVAFWALWFVTEGNLRVKQRRIDLLEEMLSVSDGRVARLSSAMLDFERLAADRHHQFTQHYLAKCALEVAEEQINAMRAEIERLKGGMLN